MTAKDVYERLMQFIENDFSHLRSKVDKLIWIILTGLVGIIGGLLYLILRG